MCGLSTNISEKEKSEIVWSYLVAFKQMYWSLHPNEKVVDIVLEKDSISIFPHSNEDEEIKHD